MARNNRLEQDTEEGFLRRWARRKAGRDEDLDGSVPEASSPEEASAAVDVEQDVEPDDEPTKTDADMPPLESIGPGSDISDFLSPGVSETLRNQALRRLFHLPAYNVTDGLDDYAENYNNFQALGDVMTADRRYREEFEKTRAAEKRAASESEPAEVAMDDAGDDQHPDPSGAGEGEEGEEGEAASEDIAAHRSDEEGENGEERTNTPIGPGERGVEA